MGFVTEEEHGAPFFVRFDDIFRMNHMQPLHPSMVRLVALSMAHKISLENTPNLMIVDPYYMQEMFVNSPRGRASATQHLEDLFVANISKHVYRMPYFPK